MTLDSATGATAARGQPSNYLILPANSSQCNNTTPVNNQTTYIVVKDAPCSTITYAGGATGFKAPNGNYYGGGGSQDDSTPAQDGHWWFEFTNELPPNYAFKDATNNTIVTFPTTDVTHFVVTLVSGGSGTKSGDAIVNYPILIAGTGITSATFSTTVTKAQVTIGTKVIKMAVPNSADAPSTNGFVTAVPDPTSYSVSNPLGTLIDGVYRGSKSSSDVYISYSFANITSFNSFKHPLAGVNFPTNIDVAPYNTYKYIHYVLIGGGDAGRPGPGERIIEEGLSFSISSKVILSFLMTLTLSHISAKY
jgi:hypothetical protein